ncbi:uncharacterized protein tasor2 isoform X2 [Esox lucius]|uniref:uncharacterized protein tasor2 isoform X2 n=1 Tax=Esox lucius TaxID=8010 RepID=UPI001477870A|nr:uncharacterized protein tasor2 isoform X2 [Esox lucius]
MEIDNANDETREGDLVAVLPGSENFENTILPPLQNSYMYEESKQSFRYNSAFLIRNDTLQRRYEAFRTCKRAMGYSEEELEESFGFLLFDDENKANKLGETGVIPGHTTCTTLGDPSKGVYISKYSDCLDVHRWYHGKSGYIAIIRLTKGRVKEVTANYTVNYTSPTDGFDCHVSEQISDVSANTSSFLAFERTQYYMYEQTNGGKDSTTHLPSHACPFAIVAFSYWNAKTPKSDEQAKSEVEKSVFCYYPWRGQLQISSQVYLVGLKSSTGPLMPAQLPTVVRVDGAIKMSELRQKLPKAIFETCFSGEASLEGMSCSLYELAPSEVEDTSLSQLTQELKIKDLALTVQLKDSGFLILLHSFHFLTLEDAGSNKPEVLQAMFLFPDSRTIQRDTKICWKNPCLSPEGLQVVPALNYAEAEVEKCHPEQCGELHGLLEQHIQSYAALIHPGLTSSPSREASVIPDQFDFPDALKYLYSPPKWTEMGWLRLKSYFHQPASFELSVSRAMEILAAGREKRGDESDDDVYYCLSSPEGSPISPANVCGLEEERSQGEPLRDKAAHLGNAAAVSLEDIKISEQTRLETNTPEKEAEGEEALPSPNVQERVPNVQPNNVKENVLSALTLPAIPVEEFGKPGLNEDDWKATGSTLFPKEVQEEPRKKLPCDLSQLAVLKGDPGKTKVDCNVPVEEHKGELEKMPSDISQPAISAKEMRKAVQVALAKADWLTPEVELDNEGMILLPKEVQKDTAPGLPQPVVSAEELGKPGLSASGKADCKAVEVELKNEGTNLHSKELQKDIPSSLSQLAVLAKELVKPGLALATKPNSKAVDAIVEDNGRDFLQKEVQEEVCCDLSQLAVSAKASGVASMAVMAKATEVTGVSTSSVSADLPTVIVITATEKTEAVLPHSEKRNIELTKNSSLPSDNAEEKGKCAVNGESEKAIQPSVPSEVSNFSKSDWRKRPRKRRRFSGLGKRVLRSTAADFEKEETQKNENLIDLSKDYPLKKRKEGLDKTQVKSLKMQRELINLIQDSPLKQKEKTDVTMVRSLRTQREQRNFIQESTLKTKDVTKVQSLKTQRELVNLIQDSPSAKKERMDVTKVQSLKTQRELMNLIVHPPLKKEECKDSIHFHPLKSKESMDLIHNDHPLKKKTERWDLKAIISECGRIFVPHGSEVVAKDIESLKVKGKGMVDQQCADEMMVEACFKVPQAKERGDSLELKMSSKDTCTPLEMSDSKDHPPEVTMDHVDTVASQNSEPVPNKDKECPSEKHKKRQYVAISLSKLKTVLSRGGKRKTPFNPESEELSSLHKKSKDEHLVTDKMESVNLSNIEKDRTTAADNPKEQTLRMDPNLALALGLTPKELHKDVQEAPQTCDVPLREGLQNSPDLVTPQDRACKRSKVLASSPSSTTPLMGRGRRSKKKHKPAEFIRKKWWLHYHTPASFESEKVAQPISSQLLTLDPDVRRVVSRGRHRKCASAVSCPPVDALSLLADLALSTSSDKVLDQQPETGALEKLDVCPSLVISDSSVKDGGLPLQPDGSFRQAPISEGIQHNRKAINDDGTQVLQTLICQERDQNRKELGEEPKMGPESLSKGIARRQKFRRLRQFLVKDDSVQVTRLWKENYDFSADSKFTNDPMDKTVIRALHGPWDFEIDDTNEQVQLIIHMWIGLFYSRSTARFFQADPSLSCLEEKDCTEVFHGMMPSQVPSETKASSPAYIALSNIPEPHVLDLSNVANKEAQPLSLEPKVLDLSMKTTSAVVDLTVNTEAKQKILFTNPPVYQPENGIHQENLYPKQSTGFELKVYRDRLDSTMSDRGSEQDYDDDDDEINHDYDSKGSLQSTVSPLESDGSYLILCEQAAGVYINQDNVLESHGNAQVSGDKYKKDLQREGKRCVGEQITTCLKTMESKDVNKTQQGKDNDSVNTMPELKQGGNVTNMAETVKCDANNPRDWAQFAICDVSDLRMEVPKTDPNIKNSVETAKPELMKPGKNMEMTKAEPDVYVSCETIDKDIKAVYNANVPKDVVNVPKDDGNSDDTLQTEIQDGKDAKDDVLPVENDGKDSVDEVSDGNTLSEALPGEEKLGNEKDSENATSSTEHCRNDSRGTTPAEKSFGKLYRSDGNSYNEVQTQDEMQDGMNTGDNVLLVLNSEKDSGDKVLPVMCDGNISLDETPPESGISQSEKDSRNATLSAVHSENYSQPTTLPVNVKLCVDQEPTVVHDRKCSTDEAIPMEQSGDVLVTGVLPKIQAEVTSKDKVLPTEIYPVSYGKMPYVGEFDTHIYSENVLREAETAVVETDFNAGFGRDSTDQEQKSMQCHSKSDNKTHVLQHCQEGSSEVVTGQMVFRIPSEDLTHTKVAQSEGQGALQVQGQVDMPISAGVGKVSKGIAQSELCQEETPVSSAFDGGNSFSDEMLIPLISKGTKSDSICAVPTVDEMSFGCTPIPDIYSAGSLAVCNVAMVSKPLSTGKGHSRCPTPTQDEPPFVPELSHDHHAQKTDSLPISNNTNKNTDQNHLESAVVKHFSDVLTDSCKKPVASSIPLTPASSEKPDHHPSSKVQLATIELDLHSHLDHDSLDRFHNSYPKKQCPLAERAALSIQSVHPKALSNETLDMVLSEVFLEGDNLSSASTEYKHIKSFQQNIPVVSGPTAASQNLTVHNFKSEESREEYNRTEGPLVVDTISSDAFKDVHPNIPVLSNTNAHPYNTQFVTEMRRQIASSQDYKDVLNQIKEPALDQDGIESVKEKKSVSDKEHVRSKSRLNKTKLDFINSLRQYQEWEKKGFDEVLDFSKPGTSSSFTFQSEESEERLSRMEENKPEWLKYCRAKRSGCQMNMTETYKEDSSVTKPCLVTVLDAKGNRTTYENHPVLKPTANMQTWAVPNSNKKSSSSFLEFSKRWDDTHNAVEEDVTQSSLNLETLIFSEKMNQLLKPRRKSSGGKYNRSRHNRSNVDERTSTCGPALTVHFSRLQEEQDGSAEHWEELPPLKGQKITVEMPERKGAVDDVESDMPQHLGKLSYTKDSEVTRVKVSDLVAESFKAYHAMMNEVCAGRKYPSRSERIRREGADRNSLPKSQPRSNNKDFCGQMKKDMCDSLHDNLNSVVRHSCKNKFRFYIMVTSDDPFFKETKELLEAEGHIAVEPSEFCLGKDIPSSPLHIILRNEDIAEHICQVPHLLELKKSPNVLFAGIDRPDDIINLTHQELFCKGGFVVFEGAALDSLSLSNMKIMSGFLEGLSKKGKWKWLLHYRDSRKLKENARSSAEAKGKKIFMDVCQEAGMVEVLPYHDCDVISRERPNYLHCLERLQVQNISARLPVFITDTTADKAFAKHGIFTMNINSFLLLSQSDTCTIS